VRRVVLHCIQSDAGSDYLLSHANQRMTRITQIHVCPVFTAGRVCYRTFCHVECRDEAKGGAFEAVAGKGRETKKKTIHRRLVITHSPDMYCNLSCNHNLRAVAALIRHVQGVEAG
jgi:hypothetical protein